MIAFSDARHEPHAMMVKTIAAMLTQLTVLCAIRKNYLEIYTHTHTHTTLLYTWY